MCRLLAYLGSDILIDSILVKPSHSLINQSLHADESKFVVNGDGFGMSWYLQGDPEPALFKTLRPAWNDPNLKDLSKKTKTHCLSAHIRAATTGNVSHANSHPFRFGSFSMMHNGEIAGFSDIKRPLRRLLSDATYNWIQGQTDTEHFFALVMDYLLQLSQTSVDANSITQSLKTAISTVHNLLEKHSDQTHLSLNTVITNGEFLVVTRYADPASKPPSLHYITGSHYEFLDEKHHIHRTDQQPTMIIVASEILTQQHQDWTTVPVNHVLHYQRGHEPLLKALAI